MVELIANAPDVQTFASVAAASGFMTDDGSIINNGQLNTIGSWFYNYVGVSIDNNDVPRPGVWARLRVNGEPDAALDNLITNAKAAGVTIYSQIQDGESLCWSSDGLTCAADQSIGLIGQLM